MARHHPDCPAALKNREIIFEFHKIGQYMKVVAMDTRTLTEISVSGPVNTPQSTIELNALRRLEYVLRKKGLID